MSAPATSETSSDVRYWSKPDFTRSCCYLREQHLSEVISAKLQLFLPTKWVFVARLDASGHFQVAAKCIE
jgi:hypothetical protein